MEIEKINMSKIMSKVVDEVNKFRKANKYGIKGIIFNDAENTVADEQLLISFDNGAIISLLHGGVSVYSSEKTCELAVMARSYSKEDHGKKYLITNQLFKTNYNDTIMEYVSYRKIIHMIKKVSKINAFDITNSVVNIKVEEMQDDLFNQSFIAQD